MNQKAGIVVAVRLDSNGMFGEISLAICGIDISAQCSLSPNKREEAIVVVSICIPAQSVAPVDRVATGFGNFRSGDELATLEFRRYLPQLMLFPSGIRLRCFCVLRLVRKRGRMLRSGRVGSHADVQGGGPLHIN